MLKFNHQQEMARLDKERQERTEPERIKHAKEKIEQLGYPVQQVDNSLHFNFKESLVIFWPYSGWHTGKSIKDGRGLLNLLKQL